MQTYQIRILEYYIMNLAYLPEDIEQYMGYNVFKY